MKLTQFLQANAIYTPSGFYEILCDVAQRMFPDATTETEINDKQMWEMVQSANLEYDEYISQYD